MRKISNDLAFLDQLEERHDAKGEFDQSGAFSGYWCNPPTAAECHQNIWRAGCARYRNPYRYGR